LTGELVDNFLLVSCLHNARHPKNLLNKEATTSDRRSGYL